MIVFSTSWEILVHSDRRASFHIFTLTPAWFEANFKQDLIWFCQQLFSCSSSIKATYFALKVSSSGSSQGLKNTTCSFILSKQENTMLPLLALHKHIFLIKWSLTSMFFIGFNLKKKIALNTHCSLWWIFGLAQLPTSHTGIRRQTGWGIADAQKLLSLPQPPALVSSEPEPLWGKQHELCQGLWFVPKCPDSNQQIIRAPVQQWRGLKRMDRSLGWLGLLISHYCPCNTGFQHVALPELVIVLTPGCTRGIGHLHVFVEL